MAGPATSYKKVVNEYFTKLKECNGCTDGVDNVISLWLKDSSNDIKLLVIGCNSGKYCSDTIDNVGTYSISTILLGESIETLLIFNMQVLKLKSPGESLNRSDLCKYKDRLDNMVCKSVEICRKAKVIFGKLKRKLFKALKDYELSNSDADFVISLYDRLYKMHIEYALYTLHSVELKLDEPLLNSKGSCTKSNEVVYTVQTFKELEAEHGSSKMRVFLEQKELEMSSAASASPQSSQVVGSVEKDSGMCD